MNIQEKEIVLTFWHLLKLLKVQVVYSDLNDFWQSHPDYLSMAFFADACKKYNITYAALEFSSSDFGMNGFPFITHLAGDGGHFVIVEDINDSGKITYYQSQNGYNIMDYNAFMSQWSGSVFYAFPTNKSGDIEYLSRRIKELLLQVCPFFFWIVFLVLCASSLCILKPDVLRGVLLLLIAKCAGLFVCMNLVYHDIFGENRISKTICTKNKYTSCDDVLQSTASKIWGIHMSDFGFVYFGGGLVALILSLFLNIQYLTLSMLFVLTLCSIPYVIFSIYYQLVKVKKICPFCISVIFVLMFEMSLFLLHVNEVKIEYIFNWEIVIPFGSLLLVMFGWIIVKRIVIRAKDGFMYKYKYLRLKKNPLIFNSSLEKEPSTDIEVVLDELIIGNPMAITTLTTVINTNCAPCARMHRRIHTILNDFGKDIRVIVRFVLTNDNRKETLFLIRLYYLKGANVFSDALNEWFNEFNFNKLVQRYPEIHEYTHENEIIDHWINWLNKTNVLSTPTVFLNDKRIEDEYDIDDIYWLVQNRLYDEHL